MPARRSELNVCSAGSGIADVVVATVLRSPIGSSTCSWSSWSSGLPPICSRMWPRIMKLVWA